MSVDAEWGLQPVYELQLVVLGMVLAKVELLETVNASDFTDDELRTLIGELKRTVSQKKRAPTELKAWLWNRGCEVDRLTRDLVVELVVNRNRFNAEVSRAVDYARELLEALRDTTTDGQQRFLDGLRNARDELEKIEKRLDGKSD